MSWEVNAKEKNYFSEVLADETKKGLDILVYGDSNTGKTYFCNTFPEPIFFIDTEGREAKTQQFHFNKKKIYIATPLELREEYKQAKEIENAVDMEKSVDNLINALIQIGNKVKSGEIKQGTLVIDSMSDVWSWIMEEGKIRLAKAGKIDLNLFRLKNQMDWGGITNKYISFLLSVKSLTSHGINIVLTAREKKTPEYIAKPQEFNKFEDKIRVQKDTPYHISTIISLNAVNIKTPAGIKKKRTATIEKLESIDVNDVTIEDIDYNKLIKIVHEKRKELIGDINAD